MRMPRSLSTAHWAVDYRVSEVHGNKLREDGSDKQPSTDTHTASRATRTRQGHDDGVLIVSNVPPKTPEAVGTKGTPRKVRATRDAYVSCFTLSSSSGFPSGLGAGLEYLFS